MVPDPRRQSYCEHPPVGLMPAGVSGWWRLCRRPVEVGVTVARTRALRRRSGTHCQDLGTSQGGSLTKVHLRTNAHHPLISLTLTPDEAHDSAVYSMLMKERTAVRASCSRIAA